MRIIENPFPRSYAPWSKLGVWSFFWPILEDGHQSLNADLYRWPSGIINIYIRDYGYILSMEDGLQSWIIYIAIIKIPNIFHGWPYPIPLIIINPMNPMAHEIAKIGLNKNHGSSTKNPGLKELYVIYICDICNLLGFRMCHELCGVFSTYQPSMNKPWPCEPEPPRRHHS